MIWVVSWSFEDHGGQVTYDNCPSPSMALVLWYEDMICDGLSPERVVKLTLSRPDVHLTTRSRPRKV